MKLETLSPIFWVFFVTLSQVEAVFPGPLEGASPAPSERSNPTLPEETVIASAEAVAVQDHADSP